MAYPYDYAFQAINSTIPSFASTLGSSQIYQLETTGREWSGPGHRAVRVSARSSTPIFVLFGSSLVSPSTQTSMLIPNPMNPTIFRVTPGQNTYIGIASSTDVVAQVTLGYGA